MRTVILGVLALFGVIAGAEQYFNGGTNLGNFAQVKCDGTSVICRQTTGNKLLVQAYTTAGLQTITAPDAGNATVLLQADNSDDSGDDWQIRAAASGNAFTLSNDTSGSQVAKFTLSTAGALSSVVSITGTGGGALSGYLSNQVTATATTITAAQCGSTFINAGAIAINLPEASTAVGCRLTFITDNAANFDVNPDDADQILVQTDAAGDSIRNATLGNSITLQAVSASEWAPLSVVGTWSDNN